ncbi:hypothetical protein UPA1_G0618 [Ureaplasma parvum serovar 1 str. ATCC 27813]|nr:hypothetical protein UPA1_A0002 [Ureaplasma parvum serovar 1 str. ATCC 27813]EDT48710.1 hypothetical protein UPA1_E0001 [Ureaplasma parvum serovar 1 str. ATCC 27813]EDT49184.1 hypothetical protein UPA1_G0618 [Ureaplasma parvum serovar 1 str. ATCC 27813]
MDLIDIIYYLLKIVIKIEIIERMIVSVSNKFISITFFFFFFLKKKKKDDNQTNNLFIISILLMVKVK